MEFIIKIKKKRQYIFRDKWVWKMAWKDARHNFSRLFLFISSVIIGVAAVVAINSFNVNLQRDIDSNAKDLLGADFAVTANKPFETELLGAFDSLKAEKSEEVNLGSMVMFMTSTSGTRLARVVAIKGNFPFYGEVETSPADAFGKMKSGKYALIDENLARQYDVSSDDSLKIGNVVFKVAGEVKKIPGGGGIQSTFAPSVYISGDYIDSTGLIQYGSRVNYKRLFKSKNDQSAEKELAMLKPLIRKYGHSFETVQIRKNNLGEGFQNLYRFFNLLAFIALILGCIGVASSVHIYVREKRKAVAVLRCIGASGWQSFNIFFIQTVVLGLIGSILGVLLGLTVQFLLPLLLREFIPLDLEIGIAWSAIAEGLLLGVIVSILFSILPLLAVRFIPPLAALRPNFNGLKRFSKTRFFTILGIIVFPMGFAAYLSDSLLTGVAFFGGMALAFACLTLVANGLISLAKKFFPNRLGFVWRQAMANLFRPNNQTTVLVVVIGLGAFLVATLNLVQNSLLNQVEFVGNENQSNTILFDIQPYQKEGVVELAKNHDLPITQLVPIVTCRLGKIKDKTVEEIQADTTDAIPNWAVTREYRVTYRDSLAASEKLVEGKFFPKVNNPGDSVYVTISEGMSENLQVGLGDSLIFDIQGIPIKTYIGGIRTVEWANDPPNFIFVFPTGVLEKAPQIYVLTTRVDDEKKAARFQKELVTLFSNVSLIDLRLILGTLNDFFDKVAFIIEFMALFSIITGLIVLAGAVINSKYLRLKENVLLRTIGALQKQISRMTLIEYGYLGFFAGLTGIGLSLISGWALAYFFFEIVFAPDIVGLMVIWTGVIFLTMGIGWFNTREVVTSSPLEVLRREV